MGSHRPRASDSAGAGLYEPGVQVAFILRLPGRPGWCGGKVRTAIFYQGYRTDQSPAVRVSRTVAILQPRSTEDVVGVSVGYCFR